MAKKKIVEERGTHICPECGHDQAKAGPDNVVNPIRNLGSVGFPQDVITCNNCGYCATVRTFTDCAKEVDDATKVQRTDGDWRKHI